MIEFVGSFMLMVAGAFTLLLKDNLLKKVIGLGLFTDGIHLFLISLDGAEEVLLRLFRIWLSLTFHSW